MAANANEKRKTVKGANIKKKFNTLNRFQNENTRKKILTLTNFRKLSPKLARAKSASCRSIPRRANVTKRPRLYKSKAAEEW